MSAYCDCLRLLTTIYPIMVPTDTKRRPRVTVKPVKKAVFCIGKPQSSPKYQVEFTFRHLKRSKNNQRFGMILNITVRFGQIKEGFIALHRKRVSALSILILDSDVYDDITKTYNLN